MKEVLAELLFKMADDALIIGHRNSEWTGWAPTLEEDISFSSMAQDKIGHAWALYRILHRELGHKDPDRLAFARLPEAFRCCTLVEPFSHDFAFAVVRQFLFDHAEYLRYSSLKESAFRPLAELAAKVTSEIKYHLLHGDVWVKHLSAGNADSKQRMQQALERVWPLALTIFEPGPFENTLREENLFAGEDALQSKWEEAVMPVLQEAGLEPPTTDKDNIPYGGRKGIHGEDFLALLKEMREVYESEPEGTEW